MTQLSQQQKSVWADHLQAQRNSGLTQQAYCQQQSLKPHQFWYWKRKLEGKPIRPKVQPASRRQGFVPVRIATPPSVQALSITLPNGITLSGIAESNRVLAQQLIGSLK